MKKNILLTIEYDGSMFHGWQKQPNTRTVQGYLEETISSALRRKVELNGTSRTDAGVHALGQRASFFIDVNIPVEKFPLIINNALKGREKNSFALLAVRVLAAEEKPIGFHARFDCRGKEYIYRIKNCGQEDVFSRNYVCGISEPLDVSAMKEGAAFLKGTHDFKSFESAGGNPRQTTVRTIFSADVICAEREACIGYEDGRMIELHVSGDGFLYNMVRIITGTLIEIGLKKRSPGDMKSIIEACDRRTAGYTAPPYGLYLAEIFY